MRIDAEFVALSLDAVADAALASATALGASYADVRVVATRASYLVVRDGSVETAVDEQELGVGVRVIVDGCWGFAAGPSVQADAAAAVAAQAVGMARISRPLTTKEVALAPEAVQVGEWTSAYDVDPFSVPEHERVALLAERSAALASHASIAHASATAYSVKEQVFFANSAGTRTTQQRIRLHPELEVVHITDDGHFETMNTAAPPVARGWEYVTGDCGDVGGARRWNWDHELATLADLVVAKAAAPSIEPGRYTLVIDPTNLWLTIHESVGHATELDRALGYEANYAGTSFATPDKLGSLRYGSDLMHVTGDRVTPHGLSTLGWDDEGVTAQQWDLIRDGVLVGYQLDRSMAGEFGLERSNGCAYADSAVHTPIQRMPNVSLSSSQDGPDLAGLIGGVQDGLYIVGDNSWSIDMQRYNFQFTGQRFFRIKSGRLEGQVRDVAYQATTTDFWGSMVATGGLSTYLLGGAFNCGKGQPAQVAPVSHGCPAAVFENVNVLNSAREGAS